MRSKSRGAKGMLILWALVVVALASICADRAIVLTNVSRDNARKEGLIVSSSTAVEQGGSLEQEFDSLAAREDYETRQLYQAGEMDAYKFGIFVNEMLLEHGITVASTKMQESGDRTVLEYVLRSPTLNFLEFLKAVTDYEKRLETPFLSLKVQGNEMQAVMRITYARS